MEKQLWCCHNQNVSGDSDLFPRRDLLRAGRGSGEAGGGGTPRSRITAVPGRRFVCIHMIWCNAGKLKLKGPLFDYKCYGLYCIVLVSCLKVSLLYSFMFFFRIAN